MALVDDINQVVSQFEESLDRIRGLASEIIAATSLSTPQRKLNETKQSAATVLLTGFFEAFLKDIVKAYVSALPHCGLKFQQLPAVIQQVHFEAGGSVLSEAARRSRVGKAQIFTGIDVADVVRRLQSHEAPPSEYYVLWEAFADTRQNPGTEVVKDICKNLSIGNVWPTIHDLADDTTLSLKLSELVEKRNECAHTGRIGLVPTAVEVTVFCDVLQKIAMSLSSMFGAKIQEFCALA